MSIDGRRRGGGAREMEKKGDTRGRDTTNQKSAKSIHWIDQHCLHIKPKSKIKPHTMQDFLFV